MAIKKIDDSLLTNIADAIRAKNGSSDTYTVSQMSDAICDINTVEHIEWHQCPELPRNFISEVTYDPSDYTVSQITDYAPATPVSSNTKPIEQTVDGVAYCNEIPNEGTPFSSTNIAGTIKPLDRVRWINSSTDNVRDLGGWVCDGGTVKYGILFRGGECKEADKSLMVDDIGIRVELNLRGNEPYTGNDRNYSLWGIKFIKPSKYAWYSLVNTSLWQELLSAVFEHASYGIPIYFHCSAGADRTGTLACVLEALLGVSQSDIDKDYELTCFYTGTSTDQQARRRNESDWQGLINQIDAMEGTSFSDKVIQWAGRLGFTAKQINQFRHAMINGNPTDVVVAADTVTVTTNLTNCTFDGLPTAVRGEPYSATITPNDGTTLQSVTYAMSGVEYTSSSELYIANVTGDITITAVAEESGPAYTNQIPISTDESGNLFVGTNGEAGYKTGYRLSLSAGNEKAYSGSEVTGFMPATEYSVVRLKNIAVANDGYHGIVGYDANKTFLGGVNLGLWIDPDGDGVYEQNGNAGKLNYYTVFSTDNLKYIRICSSDINENSIITVDEEITE